MTDPVPNELEALINSAMGSLTPLMTQVYSELDTNNKVQYKDDALLLFTTSVVLHLKAAEVASLITTHGIQNVANAFYNRFGRPMIETEQLSSYQDPIAAWNGFWNWTQSLWSTIDSSTVLTGNVSYLAIEVFDHNKGYNRACNFAANATMPPDVAAAVATPLASCFDTPAPAADDPKNCGLWIYQAFNKALLIPAGQAVDWATFQNLAQANWTVIASALGTTQGVADVVNDAMKDALDDMSMLS
jgi:hypothetical protein